MTAFGTVHGKTIELDDPVPELDGQRVRLVVESAGTGEPTLGAETQTGLSPEWAGGEPQGSIGHDSVAKVAGHAVIRRLRAEADKAPPDKREEAHGYIDALTEQIRDLPRAGAESNVKVLLGALEQALHPSSWPVIADAMLHLLGG